jgi:hypothetical protein
VKLFHLDWGIFQWANEGGDLVSAPGVPADQVHPNNSIWGRLLQSEKRAEVEAEEDEKSESE